MFSVDRYMGRTYDDETYNCWDFLREAWRDLTGHDIGDRTPHPATALAMRRRFDQEESDFDRLPGPRSPCIVLMRRPKTVPHVGLFLRGKVLHIRPDGTRYDRLADAALGFKEVRFYAARDADRRPSRPGDVGAP